MKRKYLVTEATEIQVLSYQIRGFREMFRGYLMIIEAIYASFDDFRFSFLNI